MILNNRLYNILKSIAQIWLPALGTLIFTFTDVWGLSYGLQIVGTITAVDTFLGVGLGLSSRVYNSSDQAFDGDIVVNTKDPTKDTYSLNLGIPIAEIATKKSINFRVMEAPESHTIT